jgi:two-component system phosphate regulon response regulator OmpR
MNNYMAHILVVDDDNGIRSLVKQYLNENNFLVTTANSAEDAEEKVLIIKFDLIVLDVMMPGKNGLQFILRIKNILNKTKKNNQKRVIEFDNIKIDLNKLLISKNGSEFKINNTEKIILEKMINEPGKTFSRDDIGKLIDLNKERSIDVIITRLRKKIEIDPKKPKYLQTLRGMGYVLWIE